MYDLVIEGGTVVDGTGAPSFTGSVYLRDGRIARILQEDAATLPAAERLHAAGKVVAPGFVDVHTHYDAQVFWDPLLSPSPFHGVTTVIGGNCGFTIAPLSGEDDDAQYLKRMLARVEGMPLESLDAGVPWGTWRSFGEYLDCLTSKLAVNAGFLVGHSALRRTVMGARANTDAASEADLEAMQALLRDSLDAGGLGFSSTLSNTHNDMEGNPVPSRFANHAELLALCSVCRDVPGTVLEFLPGTKEFDENTYELMASMSLAAERPLNWNVFVPGNPAMDQSQLGATDYARARGADVIALTPAQPVVTRINLHSGRRPCGCRFRSASPPCVIPSCGAGWMRARTPRNPASSFSCATGPVTPWMRLHCQGTSTSKAARSGRSPRSWENPRSTRYWTSPSRKS